jgi:hypothetical protein
MSSNAGSFLAALGPDEEEPTKPRRPRSAVPPQAVPANALDPAPTDPAPAAPAPPTGRTRRRRPEPKHKITVNVPITVKEAMEELYARDHVGPQGELEHALRAHLAAKGIVIESWEG